MFLKKNNFSMKKSGKKTKILLVNPWVYDFSAYSFWAKPLGLLKVAEYLSACDVELKLIDCMEIHKFKKYNTGKYYAVEVEKPLILKNIPYKYKRYGIEVKSFIDEVLSFMPFDVVLITSIMSYWYEGVKKAIDIIKELSPSTPVILGGIYATLYNEHAKRHINADFIYKGQINDNFLKVVAETGNYLKKIGENISYYKLHLYRNLNFAPLLTSFGCPFQCDYCASRLIYSKYERKDVDLVFKEILDLVQMGVQDIAFYDDALLVDSENYIKPLLRKIIKSSITVRFHTPNGLHARFIDEEMANLFYKANFKTLRLSLETVNENRQKQTGNKVNNTDIERAVKSLKKVGFTKNDIGVYLMYGLPDQSLVEVKEGVKFLKSLQVKINLAEFSPIKGTTAWDKLVKKGIISDDLDPLLTNNSIYSVLFSGYNFEDIRALKISTKIYNSDR